LLRETGVMTTTKSTASSQCISIGDFAEMTNEQLEQVKQAATDPSDCTGFYYKVKSLEALVTACYMCAARLARRTSNLKDVCELWNGVSEVCDTVLGQIKALKNSRPDCGAGQLYDLVLEYKIAAMKRHKQTLEDLQWEATPAPAGLFPQSS
jgi:hypothetical protein